MAEVWDRPTERSCVNTRMSARDTAGDHGKVGTVQALRELMSLRLACFYKKMEGAKIHFLLNSFPVSFLW